MGFDEFRGIESFDETRNRGVYISESHTMERLIEEYEKQMQTSPNTPFFQFGITIQNHGPYTGQYDATKNFDIDQPLSPDAELSLATYIAGVIDSDRELGTLTDYLNNRPEPVILVYFGDHLPSFSSEINNILLPPTAPANSFEGHTRLYKTPFIIWENKAAKVMAPLQKPVDRELVISSSHLGVSLLRMLGFDELDPFKDYVNDLSEAYPVILENNALTSDGEFIDLSESPSSQIDFYRSWQYYWIFH
jgi:hypothetical protein